MFVAGPAFLQQGAQRSSLKNEWIARDVNASTVRPIATTIS
jgi:hypothetical protein